MPRVEINMVEGDQGGRNASHRETETWNRFWLSIGILFTASFAGAIWATLVSSNYYAFWDGIALGFFLGATLVMTALLASMQFHSESWIRPSSFRQRPWHVLQ